MKLAWQEHPGSPEVVEKAVVKCAKTALDEMLNNESKAYDKKRKIFPGVPYSILYLFGNSFQCFGTKNSSQKTRKLKKKCFVFLVA